LALGDLQAAVAAFRESLELRRALGNVLGIAECIEGYAAASVDSGQQRHAARLYGAAESVREITGAHLSILEREDTASRIASIRAQLGDQRFAAEWAAGRAMAPNEAAELALGSSVLDGAVERPSVLTPRECEVAVLVARGLTNREMASRLSIAERTVETHLEHIFDKLGAQARSEVAVWVTRQGLLDADDAAMRSAQSSPAGGTSGSARLGRRR
jgi:DNA-binding CsgD family transcriptional regulator